MYIFPTQHIVGNRKRSTLPVPRVCHVDDHLWLGCFTDAGPERSGRPRSRPIHGVHHHPPPTTKRLFAALTEEFCARHSTIRSDTYSHLLLFVAIGGAP